MNNITRAILNYLVPKKLFGIFVQIILLVMVFQEVGVFTFLTIMLLLYENEKVAFIVFLNNKTINAHNESLEEIVKRLK